MIRRTFLIRSAATVALASLGLANAKAKQIDWNDKQLSWFKPKKGFQALKDRGKNGLLVVFAEWCPVCHQYSKVFHEPEVVKSLQGVTIMRMDQDGDDQLLPRFAPDGEYVPRTFFLNSKGALMDGVFDADPKFKHFYFPDQASDFVALVEKVTKLTKSQN
jgi:thiol:disulfide interchange protein